jgi:hypothetical protein
MQRQPKMMTLCLFIGFGLIFTGCDTLPTEGQPCSEDGSCAEGNSCVEQVCVSIESQERGAEGGPCYANATCNSGYTCESEECVVDPSVGTEGYACYPNETCDDGLNCVASLCQAPANRDGACEVQTDCADDSLLCVEHGAETLCRLRCDPADTDDICGPKSTCFSLSIEDEGVCLPAGREDDPCPCADGYYCQVTEIEMDILSSCRTLCTLPGGEQCAADQECVLVENSGVAICQ